MSSDKRISTKLIDGANARLVIDQAELRVASGPDRGAKVELGADSLIIGSSPGCDLVLHDATVSAKHAEIRVTTRGYSIRDLGSKNGILLGAHSIERATLSDGMRLCLGDSDIVVRSLGKKLNIALADAGEFGDLVARSVKMRALVATLLRLAESDTTVLIEGETGTGKELVAQALHRASERRRSPFVTFDCSAATASLAPSELFGHEKGAFTGASSTRRGLFEEAEGGTLFLDEIAELPLELQPLLLGALERKQSRRIGGKSDIAHDVRIIAATNRKLAEEVHAKRFREDLYYRLNVGRVRLPPLRERSEDLPILADIFAREAGVNLKPEQLAPLYNHDWPGNVRELRNIVTRMAVQRERPQKIFDKPKKSSSILYDDRGSLRPWLEARDLGAGELEREYVTEILALHDGNLSHAAEMAGISRQALTNLALKHGLHPRDH